MNCTVFAYLFTDLVHDVSSFTFLHGTGRFSTEHCNTNRDSLSYLDSGISDG